MRNNQLANWILGILASMIVGGMAWFGNKVIELNSSVNTLLAVYKIEIVTLKSELLRNENTIKQLADEFHRHELVAKREDD